MSIKLASGEGDISLTNLNEMSQKQNWQKSLGIKNWGSKHTIVRRGGLSNEEGLLCQVDTSRLWKMTLNIITFSITTIRIMTLSTTAFNIWMLV
jgi:hypothetical protein